MKERSELKSKKYKRRNILLIIGAILVLGIVSFYIIKKNNNNLSCKDYQEIDYKYKIGYLQGYSEYIKNDFIKSSKDLERYLNNYENKVFIRLPIGKINASTYFNKLFL